VGKVQWGKFSGESSVGKIPYRKRLSVPFDGCKTLSRPAEKNLPI